MAIHVIIKRRFTINDPEKLLPLLDELNEAAMQQQGYLSTATLRSVESPEDYMVISRWETAEDWQSWFQSKERRDLQGRVDSLIGERTFYEIFEPA